jgi:hypothetical protein
VHRTVSDTDDESNKGHSHRVVDHVVEQRVSNLAQGILTLGTMSGPLLIVLHLIPQGVLAGLFFVMGVQALQGNGITAKLVFLLKDRNLTSAGDPLKRIRRRSAVWAFVGLELVGFGATFAITQTIAAIGFPVFILLLIPARTWILPRYFTDEELRVLDGPTASPFTMESVGGNHGEIIDAAEGSNEVSGATTKGTNSPIEEFDEAERGEAQGYLEPVMTGGGHRQSNRRRSFRSDNGGVDEIELAQLDGK